jgi:hypothetical protein
MRWRPITGQLSPSPAVSEAADDGRDKPREAATYELQRPES